jgi:hypothetical protein
VLAKNTGVASSNNGRSDSSGANGSSAFGSFGHGTSFNHDQKLPERSVLTK